ncbi:MAG TPA: amidohydrolase family protein [Myxococcota bacterium]|nr:amidohydrolase family protein [Myxococcota bacterium]
MTRTIFRNANLLDGDRPARSGVTVVVDGERIAQVAAPGDPPAPPAREGDRVVDLAGRTLLPGLILSHYHSTYRDITIMPEPLGIEKPPGYLMLVAADNARRALHAGFTGILSAGVVNDNIDAELALAIEEGVVEGPRLVPGGLALDTTGDYNDTGKYWWRLGNLGAQRFCDGPDEFRKAVREEIKRGVRIIKIFASGGHGVAEDASTRGFAADELRAIVAAAHQRGVPVRAHCAWRDLILECVRAGVDIIDHGDAADAECIDAMLEHRTFLCPSLYLIKLLLDYRGDVPIATPAQLEAVRREFDGACEMVAKANAAGVRLVTGDDYGVLMLPHGSYARELAFYVKDLGVPPLDVLRWATRHGAEAMGRGDELGRIAPGRLADLVVVAGDPSSDIAVLQDAAKLRAVMRGGKLAVDRLGTPADA